MKSDEYIILEGKMWTWTRTPLGPHGTKAKVYLTNHRLYIRDAWFKVKIYDFPLPTIKKIEGKDKYLRIEAVIKGKTKKIDLKIKDMSEDWEWMIKDRIKVLS